jgi:hypothetical protein
MTLSLLPTFRYLYKHVLSRRNFRCSLVIPQQMGQQSFVDQFWRLTWRCSVMLSCQLCRFHQSGESLLVSEQVLFNLRT